MSSTDKAPGNADLRLFAVILGVAALVIHCLGQNKVFAFGTLGAVAFFALFPRLLAWPYRGWLKFGEGMGWLMQRLILGFIWYGMVTPVAAWFRLIGRDRLRLKKVRRDSHWEDYDRHPASLERYRRLF